MISKTFDMEKLLNYLRDMRDMQGNEKVKVIAKAESFFSGYCEAINDIENILKASNYQVLDNKDNEVDYCVLNRGNKCNNCSDISGNYPYCKLEGGGVD